MAAGNSSDLELALTLIRKPPTSATPRHIEALRKFLASKLRQPCLKELLSERARLTEEAARGGRRIGFDQNCLEMLFRLAEVLLGPMPRQAQAAVSTEGRRGQPGDSGLDTMLVSTDSTRLDAQVVTLTESTGELQVTWTLPIRQSVEAGISPDRDGGPPEPSAALPGDPRDGGPPEPSAALPGDARDGGPPEPSSSSMSGDARDGGPPEALAVLPGDDRDGGPPEALSSLRGDARDEEGAVGGSTHGGDDVAAEDLSVRPDRSELETTRL